MPGSLVLFGSLGALAAAIVILTVIVMLARPGQGGVARALAAIEKRYASGGSPTAQQSADPFAALSGWLRALALRMSPTGIAAKLQYRLDLAGNPDRWNPDRILAVKGLGLVVLAALGMLLGSASPLRLLVCAAVGGAAGFFLPDLLLYNAGAKRQARIRPSSRTRWKCSPSALRRASASTPRSRRSRGTAAGRWPPSWPAPSRKCRSARPARRRCGRWPAGPRPPSCAPSPRPWSRPAKTYHYQEYIILVWHKNLLRYLGKPIG